MERGKERLRLSPGIIVVCGPMGCGKTEEMLRQIRRAQIAGQNIQIFKHAFDDRYEGQASLNSHIHNSIPCTPVPDLMSLYRLIDPNVHTVFIDEAQFFGSCLNSETGEEITLTRLCQHLKEQGKRIVVAGLDTDFRSEPFGDMGNILAVATEVTKLTAVCMVCGSEKATRTQRLVNGKPAKYDDPIVLVGELGGSAVQSYEARCDSCYECSGRREYF